MKNNEKYLNFPIPLLQDAFTDIRQTMDNIMDYAAYVHTLKLEKGDELAQIKAAGKYFNINFGDPANAYTNGKLLFDSIPTKTPMTGIKIDVCFDYYKTQKTELEIAVLLAFLALKSIVRNKGYDKTGNEMLIARMAGFSKPKEMPETLPEPLSHYITRRKLDKIKKILQKSWGLAYYSYYTRGFFFSFTLSIEKLVFEAESKRQKVWEKQNRYKTDEARKKALIELLNRQ